MDFVYLATVAVLVIAMLGMVIGCDMLGGRP